MGRRGDWSVSLPVNVLLALVHYLDRGLWDQVGLKALEDGDRAMVRLTDVVQGRVAVMKVDIEGGELELIRGWDERALVVDHVLTEVKEFNHLVVLQLMQQRGYQSVPEAFLGLAFGNKSACLQSVASTCRNVDVSCDVFQSSDQEMIRHRLQPGVAGSRKATSAARPTSNDGGCRRTQQHCCMQTTALA